MKRFFASLILRVSAWWNAGRNSPSAPPKKNRFKSEEGQGVTMDEHAFMQQCGRCPDCETNSFKIAPARLTLDPTGLVNNTYRVQDVSCVFCGASFTLLFCHQNELVAGVRKKRLFETVASLPN